MVQKIIIKPTEIDRKVSNALSLCFIMGINPIINAATQRTAIIGVGNVSLICIAKVDIFNNIKLYYL